MECAAIMSATFSSAHARFALPVSIFISRVSMFARAVSMLCSVAGWVVLAKGVSCCSRTGFLDECADFV